MSQNKPNHTATGGHSHGQSGKNSPRRSKRVTNRRYTYDVRQYAVLENEAGQILALQLPKRYRPYGSQWTLPGGKLEPADEPQGGILREIEEETNLDAEIQSICHIDRWDSERSKKLVIFYHCKVSNAQQLVLSSEHQSSQWLTLDEALEQDFYAPYFRAAIKKCLA